MYGTVFISRMLQAAASDKTTGVDRGVYRRLESSARGFSGHLDGAQHPVSYLDMASDSLLTKIWC